jgi:hypothetical protein
MFDLDLGTYVLGIPWNVCPWYTLGDMSLAVTLTLEHMSLAYLGRYVIGRGLDLDLGTYVIFSCFMSRNSQKDYHYDCLVVNDTTSDILTN